jgi:purine-binding chemotaxis protein CheW
MITKVATPETTVLVVGVGAWLCAIPIADVAETMRPLDTSPIPDMPGFLAGLAIIRGSPVPVVDLREMLRLKDKRPIGRYVLLVLGNRHIALAVEDVVGVRRLDCSVMPGLPPLLREPEEQLVADIGVKDERLILILRAARMIPDDVWQTLEAQER